MIPAVILLIIGFGAFLFGLLAVVGDIIKSDYCRDGPIAIVAGLALMAVSVATILG